MTFSTRTQAVDEINTVFLNAWTAALQDTSQIKWENVSAVDTPPTDNTPWARFTLRHTNSSATSLTGVIGNRRYTRRGVISAQLFQPIGSGLSGDTDLAKIVQEAFEGHTTAGGVIFRGVSINEIGSDGDFFQTNVVSFFEYDEIR